MFHTLDLIIDENDDKIHVNHVQSTNCINVNVAGGVHNQCMNHTMATGNNTSERPHHTNYSIESIRIISFNNWPQFKHQTPQQLAEAGFFYAGFQDEVICFYCNGRLRNWKSNGVPWVQHARWFPYCPFVRIVKGNQFIRTIQDRFSQLDNNPGYIQTNTNAFFSEGERRSVPNEQSSRYSTQNLSWSPPIETESEENSWSSISGSFRTGVSSVEEMWPSMNEPDEMSYNNSPSSFRYESRSSWSSNSSHQEESRQVHAQMQSTMVQRVLNTGVNRTRVRNVIERRLRETGNTYPNSEALINAVLNYEQNQGELNVLSPHHQAPHQIRQTDERRDRRRRSRSSRHQEETRQLHDYMQSSMVQSVLNTGVDRNRVRNVIERRLRDRGNIYPNAETLMNAVLNYEQNREELNGLSPHHQGSPHILQTDERRNARRRSRSSTSSNDGLMNAVMHFEQNREVLNTPSSHGQDSPQNASQSHSTRTGSRTSSSHNRDLEQMVSELRQKTKCKVCLDSEWEVMFQPCNHLCCCRSCGERVETCPVCRSPIESRVRTRIP